MDCIIGAFSDLVLGVIGIASLIVKLDTGCNFVKVRPGTRFKVWDRVSRGKAYRRQSWSFALVFPVCLGHEAPLTFLLVEMSDACGIWLVRNDRNRVLFYIFQHVEDCLSRTRKALDLFCINFSNLMDISSKQRFWALTPSIWHDAVLTIVVLLILFSNAVEWLFAFGIFSQNNCMALSNLYLNYLELLFSKPFEVCGLHKVVSVCETVRCFLTFFVREIAFDDTMHAPNVKPSFVVNAILMITAKLNVDQVVAVFNQFHFCPRLWLTNFHGLDSTIWLDQVGQQNSLFHRSKQFDSFLESIRKSYFYW